MTPLKRNDQHCVTLATLAICIAAASANRDSFHTAFVFASKKRFSQHRSTARMPPLFSTEPASTPPAGLGAPPGDDVDSPASLPDRFRTASNAASLLCLLHCTVLPLVTVALPLLGAGQLQDLDALALYFVLPVGGLATLANYLSHRDGRIAALAVLGLALVGVANAHFHVDHWPSVGPFSWDRLGAVLDEVQGCETSPWHRVVNVGGCACMLGSNYWSQRRDGCAARGITGDACGRGKGCDR